MRKTNTYRSTPKIPCRTVRHKIKFSDDELGSDSESDSGSDTNMDTPSDIFKSILSNELGKTKFNPNAKNWKQGKFETPKKRKSKKDKKQEYEQKAGIYSIALLKEQPASPPAPPQPPSKSASKSPPKPTNNIDIDQTAAPEQKKLKKPTISHKPNIHNATLFDGQMVRHLDPNDLSSDEFTPSPPNLPTTAMINQQNKEHPSTEPIDTDEKFPDDQVCF